VCGYQMRSAVHILSSYLFHYKLKPPYCPNTDVPFIVSPSKAGDTELPTVTNTDSLCYKAAVLRNTINGQRIITYVNLSKLLYTALQYWWNNAYGR